MSDRYFIDTGVAIHRPQTNRIRGRRQARSVHGYLGDVLTREQALASKVALCDRCLPQGVTSNESAVGARAERLA